MAITKAQKVAMVEHLTDVIGQGQSVTFVQFDGLSMVDTSALRQHLREEGVSYKVVKKTLLKRVLGDAGLSGDMPALEGNVAMAFGSDDPTASARMIQAFRKGHEDQLTIVGGVFEGTLQSLAQMQEIATIPSLQVLRGMFVNVLNAPIQGMAIVLGQLAEKRAA